MKVLVTGGGGFLGGAICKLLLARGDRVRSYARGEYPELTQLGVEVVRGDLSESLRLAKACADCDVVIHTAAKAGIWGREADYHQTNVVGTENVIAACRAAGVSRLVYTSSPSVVFDGSDMPGVNESVPYASHFLAHYQRTKAMAEQMVLAANDAKLATVALRPHLIWGPGDTNLVPRIMARARSLRRIGNANPLVDSTYIDNAALAHVLAADRIALGSAIAGKAYFISNGEPRPLWDLVNGILAAAKLPPVTNCVSKTTAMLAARLFETTYRLCGIEAEPRLTRFLVEELTTTHWFDISAARRELEYRPKVSIDHGIANLHTWLSVSNS